MNYLNLLRELSEQYVVKMESGHANGDWAVLVGKHSIGGHTPGSGAQVLGFTVMTQGYGKTPEEAIRVAYLLVNPIPKNTNDGKLSQR